MALVFTVAPSTAFETLASEYAFSNLQRELLDRRSEQAVDADLNAPDALAAVRFTSDPALTQSNLRSFIDRTPNPKGRVELQRLIDLQPSIITDIGLEMRSRYGLDPHNVADAFSVWWITVWMAAQKSSDVPDKTTINAVRTQVHVALLNTPDFLKTSDADRQEYAEALLMQTLLMSQISQAAIGKPALQEQLATQAEQAAQNSGLTLSLMQLTPNGFELR